MKLLVFDCANLAKSIDDKIKNGDKYDTYIVYDEFEENYFLDLNNNVIGYEKINKKSSKTNKKPVKPSIKNQSKPIKTQSKSIKKPIKNQSKSTKKPIKKRSKKE